MMRRGVGVLLLVIGVALVTGPGTASAAKPPGLLAGAGQADITPPRTGYFLGGWTRADRLGRGVSTRLGASAIVLQRGGPKIALVAVGLFAVTEGMQRDVARELADLGYRRENIVMAATHTHSAPGGWTNNPTYNTAAPSVETLGDPSSVFGLLKPAPADRQQYTFLVRQIALAIRRADRDKARAAAGWGHALLTDLTVNRSIEAHLANFGIQKRLGEGRPEMAPDGAASTIDPNVDVLRVDKLVKKRVRCTKRQRRAGKRRCTKLRRRPIGAWSNFANHGTVVKSDVQRYSGDHHATAWRVFSEKVRTAGKVPAAQTVVNVYANGNEGDLSAGLAHTGVGGAEDVGRIEADKMFEAWQAAGTKLSRTPAIDLRWTLSCFCGRRTATGTVAAVGRLGAPFLTGSEEGRGPVFDITRIPLEGLRSPVSDPEQGNKVPVPIGSFPPAVPLTVLRIGDGVIGSLPGEATKQVGQHTKQALLKSLNGTGVKRAVISGLTGDYIQYISTPAEYRWQSYEGGSSLYGANEGTFLQERLVELADGIVKGTPAPDPYTYDANYGVHANGPPYPPGAASGTITTQPQTETKAGGRQTIAWQGAPSGGDMPVGAAFITAERRRGDTWTHVDDDLGLNMIWRSDDQGRYQATWQIPRNATAGMYRLVITASRYRLESTPFSVT